MIKFVNLDTHAGPKQQAAVNDRLRCWVAALVLVQPLQAQGRQPRCVLAPHGAVVQAVSAFGDRRRAGRRKTRARRQQDRDGRPFRAARANQHVGFFSGELLVNLGRCGERRNVERQLERPAVPARTERDRPDRHRRQSQAAVPDGLLAAVEELAVKGRALRHVARARQLALLPAQLRHGLQELRPGQPHVGRAAHRAQGREKIKSRAEGDRVALVAARVAQALRRHPRRYAHRRRKQRSGAAQHLPRPGLRLRGVRHVPAESNPGAANARGVSGRLPHAAERAAQRERQDARHVLSSLPGGGAGRAREGGAAVERDHGERARALVGPQLGPARLPDRRDAAVKCETAGHCVREGRGTGRVRSHTEGCGR